ncbi:uncharacterized protein [Porites lutea]|uniref:uncharacterized protein n=1 Tax=Porites lutea TaxID=51062 RepID=UPI003CC653F7
MSQVFVEEGTDGILLIDASNAFNQMNRSAALHNMQIMCKEMALYVINTYRSPSRLFTCGGGEILSREGTTQGDPLAMPWYALNTSIMIQNLRDHCPLVKQVWLADDSAGGGSIVQLYNWYRQLSKEGQKFGYLVNGTKSWLIVKSRELEEEAKRVFGEEVNITTEGQRHLGAVIASQEYKDQYCEEKVRAWKEEIERLSEIAKSQPHAAYIAFTKGYKSKFTYFMRTIESFEVYVDPIQEVIEDLLLPTLLGQSEPLPNEVRRLATLATGQGGLGIPDLKSEAPQQFAASRLIITAHVDSITSQSSIMVPGERSTEELKRHQQLLKRASAKEKMDSIDSSLSPGLLRLVNQSRDKGASSWLNAMPLADKGLALNKQEFRDSLRLRYDLPLVDFPSHCICGDKFTVSHALPCKKGGFVAQRHDGVRNLLTTFIDKICNNVEIEPRLKPLDNERFHLRSAVTSSEARSQRAVIDGMASERLPVTSGVPQGSIVGPLIFVIFINNLPDVVHEQTNTPLYADDTKLHRTIVSVKDCDILQQDLANLNTWSYVSNMKFNASKCKVLTVTRKKSPVTHEYHLGNTYMKRVLEEKDLGVIISSNLSWDSHVYAHSTQG